jgi:hypothetical protein
MLSAILLILLLMEFLVVLAVLMFTIFLARPEVPLLTRQSLEADSAEGRQLTMGRRKPLSSSTGKNTASSKPRPQACLTSLCPGSRTT